MRRGGKPPGDEEEDKAEEERSRQADEEARAEEADGAEHCGEHEPIGGDETPREETQGHRDLRWSDTQV
ncbi:MAG TPA: hypothetical protein VOA80_20265 [Thermoanaerobaculia bacterium]|nr:hypothetical protein [Thermoanaerobaculia bacterium]